MKTETTPDALTKILTKAEELFFNYGIKSITMDDLATHLGISKKTLYLYVSNKADLVNKTLKNHLELEKEKFIEITETAPNAVYEMFEIGKHVTNHLRYINPAAVYDLQKYYPETWQIFLDYKNTFIYKNILENLKKGIEQGMYREDINPDIISRIYSARSEFIIDPEIFPFPEYKILDVYTEYLKYHIRGIASAKGMQYLEKQNLSNP